MASRRRFKPWQPLPLTPCTSHGSACGASSTPGARFAARSCISPGGRWAISESARAPWRNLNRRHGDAVKSLHIADLNNNNIDDLIRLEAIGGSGAGYGAARLTWSVSDDGRGRWRRLRTYYFQEAFAGRLPRIFGLAGRFGAAPGGGVLVGDFKRTGHFFSEAEIAAGAPPDWTTISTVHY